MSRAMSDEHVTLFLDLIYQAAVAPESWPTVLQSLTSIFAAAVVDLSTRSRDGAHWSAITYTSHHRDRRVTERSVRDKLGARGRSDRDERVDDVPSTRLPVDRVRCSCGGTSNEDQDPRGAQEGLRLPLWVGGLEIQEIAIHRPWSSGAFAPAEIELGHTLLPHLQRAAAVTRRLRESDFKLEVGASGAGSATVAVVVFDAAGLPFWFNGAAEMLLAEGSVLVLSGGELHAATPGATCALRRAVARACGQVDAPRESGAVTLPSAPGMGSLNAMVVPLSNAADWATCRPPAAMAMLRQPVSHVLSREWLREVFPLTEAEAALAQALLAGRSLRSVAEGSGRSLNTIRSHLAHLMEKTETNKQTELMRLLGDVAALAAPSRPASGKSALQSTVLRSLRSTVPLPSEKVAAPPSACWTPLIW